MNSSYTPFPGKALTDLAAGDLNTLTSVQEGWYVEYKRELPNSRTIAKSLAAFANTYGGWLFIGVNERSKEESVAETCPGIPRNQVDTALQTVRAAANSHLNPTPHFETQVIWGPNPDLQLQEDFAVICVQTPQSVQTPHLHSSGMIYRRVADSSEPKPETDRHQLDSLYARGDKMNDEYKRWIERIPERQNDQQQQPYLRLLLEADLCRREDKEWGLSIKEIKETLNDPNAGPMFPLETIYPSGIGIIARQTSSLHRHEDFGLTWIVKNGLRCEIWLPINTYSTIAPDDLREHFGKYQRADEFIGMLQSAKAKDSRIMEINQLWMVMAAASSMYLNLLAKANATPNEIYAKAILGGVLHTTPFLDSSIILDRMKRHGLPLCPTDTAMIPGGTDASSFFKIDFSKCSEDTDEPRTPWLAIWLFELMCEAIGLHGFSSGHGKDEIQTLFDELQAASARARDRD